MSPSNAGRFTPNQYSHMRNRSHSSALLFAAVAALLTSGCADSVPSAPTLSAADIGASFASDNSGPGNNSGQGNAFGQSLLPGQSNSGSQGNSNAGLVRCENWPAVASQLIGPGGGQIVVGRARLIIPPGALTAPTLVTGTALPGDYPIVSFEPSGLEFKKPAGLQFDVTGCEPTDAVPNIVYLNYAGEITERIEAVYSNIWHTVAAPVRHFSNYALYY